ncbi:MAG: Lanthionine biosynthesis cyclase LanC [Gammaproteobacteria bacterium]|nr:Lanthionine biosynthesis cyclase LanC [Gammaproteobacteria bacterium]
MRTSGDKRSGELLELAVQIADGIRTSTDPLALRKLDLANGVAGVALFFAHLSRFTDPHGQYSGLARDCMKKIESELPDAESVIPGLFEGVTGIAWAAHHLSLVLGLDESGEVDAYRDVCEFIDAYLSRDVEYEYDLISGLAGIGQWALTIPDAEWRERLTARAVHLLSRSALPREGGLTWQTPASRVRRQGSFKPLGEPEFNLGVAHGIPGIIGFLAGCIAQNLSAASSRELLDGTVSWFAKQVLPEGSASQFSFTAHSDRPARLAWCYGDAGIALVLTQSARLAPSKEIAELAATVTQRVAVRQSQDAGVVDAGICHGAAGLAHLCRILALETGSLAMTSARDYWLEELLSHREPDTNICGFPYWNVFNARYEENIGLLVGVSGVGLTLLSMAGGDLGWDRPLLVHSTS